MLIGPYETGRVYQGDSLDLMRAIPDGVVPMIWTDPPYGNGNMDGDLAAARAGKVKGARVRDAEPIANDREAEYEPLMRSFLAEAARILRPDSCCCCCCGGGGPKPTFARLSLWTDETLAFDHAVVWNKLGAGPGLGWIYRRSYEFVLVSHRRGGSLSHPNDSAIPNILNHSPVRDRLHPNQKPGALIRDFINLHTSPGDLVVDPFAGSGETGVQAIRLGREFLGFELDPKYVALGNERLAATKRGNDLASERAGQINLFGGAAK